MPEVWKKWEGQVVNEEFPLLRYLGGSEHSAVFLTRRADREPQEVAIKLISANAQDSDLQLSWWELAAKLSHPHLLRLFQRGRCQLDGTDLLYAVTEYAEESLAQIIPYRPLTPAETRDMLQSVLDALAYIHAKGFVHGDIKPANVMAVGDQIKVSSDGLCGAGESSRILGMPSVYAAPEIVEGAGMSPAADVWSLGMTLVEALTQSPPSGGGIEQADPVLPQTLPEPFSDIASHCLRRIPESRWTVPAIAARLRQTAPAPTARAPLEKEIAEPKSAFAKWGYAVPAIAAGVLLLAIFGARLLHRQPNVAPPTSTVESSAKPGAAAEQPAPMPESKNAERASNAPASPNAPPPAAKTAVSKKAGVENPSAARVQGAVAQQVLPDVSRSALRTIHGKLKVWVKVTVDSSGNVTLAKFDSRGPSKYFADRTLRAAQQWTFKPPQIDGKSVPSEWMLKFEFERSGASVRPVQTFP